MDSQSNETSYDLGPLNGLADDPDFINDFLNNFDPEKDESLRTPEFEAIMQSPPVVEQLITILAQPQCSGKLRYRSSYSENSTRREPLKGSSTTYTGPAIYIQQEYLNFNRDKYVGVCLSTVKHEKTNSLYIHPYILENIDNKTQNDTKNNIVWYPLSNLTQNSILNFPDLRIVRVTEGDLESDGNLRVFHDYNSSATLSTANPIVVSKRQIKREYNLTKGQLAFFIGERQNSLDEFPTIIHITTISLSEQFDLRTEDGMNEDTESSASPPTPTDCSIYKYAPLFGFTEGDTEMIVICTKNLNKRQYGDVKIRFQSDIEQLNELEFKSIKIESNILYIRMPSLPFPIHESLDVKIKIEQTKRDLGVINYQYLNKNECMTCQMNKSKAANLLTRSNSNKRLRHCAYSCDTEYDGVVPDSERDHTPTLRHSQSEQLPNQSSSNNDEVIDTLNRLEDSIHQLFQNNDLKPVLRTSRLFIIQRPELFYEAIEKNYSDLITSFVSVAGQKLLEHRNNQGDTPFLYGIRLNRVTFIQAFLKRQDINEYIYDVNFRGQNIFHLVAMNNDSNELFELIINYLDRNSIDIKKKFDCIDADKQTPLQIAILKHNFSAIRHLIKYSDKEIVQTSDTLGENLIHFTVRYGDLMILKYLLENEDLIEQGNRSSLTMTPYELASSLNHDDMKEYLEKIYPQPKLECEEETSDNQ